MKVSRLCKSRPSEMSNRKINGTLRAISSSNFSLPLLLTTLSLRLENLIDMRFITSAILTVSAAVAAVAQSSESLSPFPPGFPSSLFFRPPASIATPDLLGLGSDGYQRLFLEVYQVDERLHGRDRIG
jgi:hypothetical protein